MQAPKSKKGFRLCFVCSGNTCRSPMAAAAANAELASRRGWTDAPITAVSAGLWAMQGERITREAEKALEEACVQPIRGLDYHDHRAVCLAQAPAEECDLLVGMTQAHTEELKQRYPHLTDRICSFPADIGDPFGRGLDAYRAAFCEIQDGVKLLLDRLFPTESIGKIEPMSAERAELNLQIGSAGPSLANGFVPEQLAPVHLAQVAALEALCFAEPWSEAALELLLQEGAVGAVVCQAGEVIAYGGMLIALDEGQITNIAAHPSHRRAGAGRAVLRALLQEARCRGLVQVVLEVRRSNQAAIALYEGEGFRVVGERRGFYRKPTEDALVMLWEP